MSRMSLRVLASLCVLSALVAGCGDDDDDAVSTPDTIAELDEPASEPGGDEDGGVEEDVEAALAATDGEDLPGWSPADVEEIRIGEPTTIPLIDRSLAQNRVLSDYWLWDWWPVRDRDGSITEIEGWNIAVALTAPVEVLPGKRHDVAALRYLLSDDGGRTWELGGELFDGPEPRGSRQWAGSTMYDSDTGSVYAFYTAAGEDGEEIDISQLTAEAAQADESPATSGPTTTATTGSGGAGSEVAGAEGAGSGGSGPDGNGDQQEDREALAPSGGQVTDGVSYEQRMAMSQATVEVVDGRPSFSDWTDHTVVLTDGGQNYKSTAGTTGGAGNIDAFRDPWFYQDPATGEEYLLFTATLPDDRSECPADGVVGVAQRSSEDLTEWDLLPPMLGATV